MQCPTCSTDNPEAAKFCLNCGARLALVCSQCGALLPPQAKFCLECGAQLAAPAAEPAAQQDPAYVEALQRLVPKEFADRLRATRGRVASERRMVTILFSDVKGSTALADGLDPEDVVEIMRGAFEVFIAPIYHREGTVARLMGDAILAFFGAPIAHEDDPERAIHAALDIVAGSREYAELLARERGIRGFNVRVGINTGLVVVGEVGSDLRVEYTAIGDAVNVAARMEQSAPPGGILITHDTYRLVRGVFDVLPQEPLLVKGKTEPAQTYLVQRAKPRAFRVEMRGVEGIETRMVGREAELLTLQTVFEDVVTENEPRMVTVVGDAGVGKSRLINELANWLELRPERLWYFRGQAAVDTQVVPYGLWRDLFARRFRILESDNTAAARAKFREAMAPALDPARADVVGQLVGFDFLTGQSAQSTPGSLSLRQAVSAHLLQYLRALTELGPLVVLLEDLQWADDSSLDLVAHVIGQMQGSPVFVVAAARPDLFDRRPSWGEGQAAYGRLDLKPLSKRASRALVEEILHRVDRLPDEMRDLIVDGAEGNPFYVEELIKMLLDDGVIVRAEDGWQVMLERLSEIHVPSTLTAVLQARLDALPLDERAVIQRASVVGREFWDQAVAELAEDALASRQVSPLLSALREREMVFHREQSAFAGSEEYTFKHSVLRDVAYETVLKRVRQRYHCRVAEWLENHAGERLAEYLRLIARHYELGGKSERALNYLLRAGDRARSIGAFQEAAGDYDRALSMLRETPDLDRAARTVMKLGLTYHNAFRFDEARRAFEEGFALWQRTGDATTDKPGPAPRPLRVTWYGMTTLDDAYATDSDSMGMIAQLFSGLVALGSEMTVEPDVARSWDVLDGGLRYVFHLRDDVVWSDGVPLTAADFEYAWKRVLDPAIGAPAASYAYPLAGAQDYSEGRAADAGAVGVRATDDRTLEVTLEEPTSYFLQLLATSGKPVPRHVVEAWGDAWTEPKHLVTNGPFLLNRWHPDDTIVLDRNPAYHGRVSGNVQRVILSRADKLDLVEAYEQGLLDLLPMRGIGPEDIDRARQAHADEYLSAPHLWTTFLSLNPNRPPFDDRRVRRAFVMAVDRTHLAGVVYRGLVFPANGGLVPPGMPGHSPGIGLPYDPQQARQLLAEAGFPGGGGFPLIEAVRREPTGDHALFDYLTATWHESLGVRVDWSPVSYSDLLRAADRLEPPDMWVNGWTADYADPDNFLRICVKAQTRWRNDRFGELVDAARRAPHHGQRMALYRQADRILVEEAALIPLGYMRVHTLVKPWVRYSPLPMFFSPMKDITILPH